MNRSHRFRFRLRPALQSVLLFGVVLAAMWSCQRAPELPSSVVFVDISDSNSRVAEPLSLEWGERQVMLPVVIQTDCDATFENVHDRRIAL